MMLVLVFLYLPFQHSYFPFQHLNPHGQFGHGEYHRALPSSGNCYFLSLTWLLPLQWKPVLNRLLAGGKNLVYSFVLVK